MAKASRDKGARGVTAAKHLLADRDWSVDTLTAGLASGDLIATDPAGKTYVAEIKNCASILPAHRNQAMAQGKTRKLPWMLMNKVSGTSGWLIQRQGEEPVVWIEKK